MNSTQEAVLNRFPYGRFEVFTRNLHLRRLDAKRAKRVLRQYREGLLLIKSNGEVGNGEENGETGGGGSTQPGRESIEEQAGCGGGCPPSEGQPHQETDSEEE